MPAVSDFNGMLCSSIDEAISDILSLSVMESFYMYLREKYQVQRDEVPYRLDTVFSALSNVFGVKGVRTVGRSAARNLYAHLNLPFVDKTNFTLSDYVEEAKVIVQADP